jgi:hypothetical protein
MKEQWKNFATKLRSHFPGPEYSLFEKGDFLTEVAADFTEPEANLFDVELWRGTIANVVYSRLRNPSVHSTRSSTFMHRQQSLSCRGNGRLPSYQTGRESRLSQL